MHQKTFSSDQKQNCEINIEILRIYRMKIQKNDIVLIDMGCIYNGYCSDLTRTFFTGKANKHQKKIWDIVKLAHDKALINVKQEMKASDIDLFLLWGKDT